MNILIRLSEDQGLCFPIAKSKYEKCRRNIDREKDDDNTTLTTMRLTSLAKARERSVSSIVTPYPKPFPLSGAS